MQKNGRKVRIFSALEVANLCGVVNQTAINWIRNGYLKAFTTPGGQYRVYAENLMAFLDERGMRIPQELDHYLKDDVDWNTILIVDDDRDLNDILKRLLAKKLPDFTTHQAFDGFEAGRTITEKRPGYVILDIDLPGINGHALCKTIKEDPVFGKPFILAVTGLDNIEEKEAILVGGADAFFPKPLDFDAIVDTIRDFSEKVKDGDAK